jgi:hypothetical protein
VAGDGEPATVAAHETVTIPWTGSSAWVLALPGDQWETLPAILSLASGFTDDGEPQTVVVPQNC